MPASPPSRAAHQPEPLFSLLTTSHPLLAKTIEGTTSAYNSSKNSYPKFKSSAEYVEGYLTPIGNTLGSVGRATGVEGGVRWFLGAGRRPQPSPPDLEAGGAGSNKRRKVDGSADEKASRSAGAPAFAEADPYAFTKERRLAGATTKEQFCTCP